MYGSIAQKLRRRREENRPGTPYCGPMRVAMAARVRASVHQQTDEEQR